MLKSGFYNAIGVIIQIGTSIVTLPLLVRWLGVEEYGLWTLISTTIALLAIAEVGLPISITVFAARDLAIGDDQGLAQTVTAVVSLMLLLAIAASFSMWIGAAYLLELFPKLVGHQHATMLASLQISSIVTGVRLLQQVMVGLLQAFQRYDLVSLVNGLQVVLTNLGLIVIVWYGGRVIALIGWHAAVNLATLLLSVLFNYSLLRPKKLKVSLSRTKLRMLAHYSFNTWISSLAGILYCYADRLIVGALLGPAALGIYGIIMNFILQLTTLTGGVLQPLLPIVSSLKAGNNSDTNKLSMSIKQASQINAFVILGASSILLIFAPQIMALVMGESVTSYAWELQIASTICAFYSLNAVGYYILLGIGAVRQNLTINFFSVGISLMLIASGAVTFGLTGAIVGNAGYLLSLLFVVFGLRYLRIPLQSWCKWVALPVFWFLSVLVINIVFPYDIIKLTFYFVAALILCGWFLWVQWNYIRDFLVKIDTLTYTQKEAS